MKAAILEANRKIRVRELPLQPPKEDECTVQISAAGICSSDIARSFGDGAYSYPLVMGHELAGEIVATGSSADKRLAIGDRVTIFPLLPCFECFSCTREHYAQCENYSYYGSRCHGGFAEFLNVRSWNLMKIPEAVSLEDASMVEPTAVVLHAIDRLSIEPQRFSQLCILGAGFLGLIAVQVLARTQPDCSVTVIDRNPHKLDVAAKLGAETVCLVDDTDWANYLQSNGSTFSRILEAAGVPATFERALRLVSAGGRVVWMGNIYDDLLLPKKLVSTILRKEIDIAGTWNSVYRGAADSDWTRALNLMADGLEPSRLVSAKVSLDGIAEVLSRLYAHKMRKERYDLIKAIVLPHSGAT